MHTLEKVLLDNENVSTTEDNSKCNTQAKDDHILDLRSQIDGYKIQIEQLHDHINDSAETISYCLRLMA